MNLGFIKTSLINNIARGGVWEYGVCVCEMRKRTFLQTLTFVLCLKKSCKIEHGPNFLHFSL